MPCGSDTVWMRFFDMSRSEAARRAACSHSTLIRLENGENISLRTMERIAEGIGFPLAELSKALAEYWKEEGIRPLPAVFEAIRS